MPDRLMRIVLAWSGLTTVVFWLPTVRGAVEGASYRWGMFGLGGQGIHGDYWFPFGGALIALLALAFAWRAQRWAFMVLAAWSLLLAATMTIVVWSSPGDFRFRGDTLGIDVSLAWFGPIVFWTATLLACVAAWRGRRGVGSVVAGWARPNSRWAAMLVAMLVVEAVLLSLGEAGSVADQIGVLFTIAQWLLIGQAARRYPSPANTPEVV